MQLSNHLFPPRHASRRSPSMRNTGRSAARSVGSAELSEQGAVSTPLGMQSWSDYYGELADRFGVQ